MATAAKTISLTQEKANVEMIQRFDIHQIIQHGGLAVSFIFLVLTGFPMKFHDAGISQWWVGVLGGIEAVRVTHRLFAWVMVAVCVYHLLYLAYTILVLKRPFPYKMLPSLKDPREYYEEMAYFLGVKPEKPKADRFSWKEKFDYWAIFWGMPVMAGSGFIMMFPVAATRIFPGWVVPAAMIAHSDEAMLALTWIAVVHIFFNHFSPGVFPLNKSIFTGMVPKERYLRDHALEFEPVPAVEKEKQI